MVRREISANTESGPARRGQGARSRAFWRYVSDEKRSHRWMQGRSNVPIISATGPQ